MKIWKSTGSKSFWRVIRSKIQKIGFGDILEDEEEVIESVFRRMLMRTFMRALIWFCVFVYTGALWMWFFRTSIWVYIGGASVLYGFYRIFYTFSYWYLNAIVMTTHNLIFVQWEKLFHRRTTRLDYWNLDEIEVERTGLSSYFYHYGTLHFYKANGGELYSFTQCHAPNKVAREIESYKQKLVDLKNIQEESTLKGILSGMVQRHLDEHGVSKLGDYEEGVVLGNKMRESQEHFKKVEKGVAVDNVRDQSSNRSQSVRKKSFLPFGKKVKDRVERDVVEIEVEKKMDDEGGIRIDL